MRYAVAKILLLGLTLAGCAPAGPDIDPAVQNTYLVFDYDPASEKYHLQPQIIETLDDPRAVSGSIAYMRGGGKLVSVYVEPSTVEEFEQALEVRGDREPSVEFTIEDGVIVPYDFDAQLMITLYHHLERSAEYFERIGFDTSRVGRLPVYYYPQVSVFGVSLPLLNDNAAYAFTLDAFLIPPRVRLKDDVPLSANRGVIVHEYAHAVFNRVVHEDDRSPEFAYPGYSKFAQNQIRSLDEGLADLFAALALGQADFLASSFEIAGFQVDRDLSKRRIWNETLQARVDASSTPAGLSPYILGSVIAAALWATRDFLDDETLGRTTLAAMEAVRSPPSTFVLADFFNAFLEAVPPEVHAETCSVFTDRLQLIENQLDC